MLITKYVTVEGRIYPVTLSDSSQALQAAYAAGGAIVGLWRPSQETQTEAEQEVGKEAGQPMLQIPPGCLYLTDDPDAADAALLEKAVRRRFGLPFVIGLTKRLKIREFKEDDPLESGKEPADKAAAPGERASEAVFCDAELRSSYINTQYRFYECGLWALEERDLGILVGKAGITDGELGYHIYQPYRRRGYGLEACQAILSYAEQHMGLKEVLIRTRQDNEASIHLAKALGFKPGEELEGLRSYVKEMRCLDDCQL